MSISEFFAKLFRIRSGSVEPEVFRTRLELYWRGLLICSFLGVVAAMVFAWWVFANVTVRMLHNDDTGGKVSAFDRDRLDRVLTFFDVRAEQYEALRAGSSIADPSK